MSEKTTQRDAAEPLECRSDDDHANPAVARQGALSALAQSGPAACASAEDAELAAARAEIARLEETIKEQAIELVAPRGNSARAGRPGFRLRREQPISAAMALRRASTACRGRSSGDPVEDAGAAQRTAATQASAISNGSEARG